MNIKKIFLLLSVLVCAAAAVSAQTAAKSFDYSNAAGFGASFPAEPHEYARTEGSGSSATQKVDVEASTPDGVSFFISWNRFPGVKLPPNHVDSIKDNHELLGSKLEAERKIIVNGIPGKEFTFTGRYGMWERQRVFVVGDARLIATVMVDAAKLSDKTKADADKFLNSIKLPRAK